MISIILINPFIINLINSSCLEHQLSCCRGCCVCMGRGNAMCAGGGAAAVRIVCCESLSVESSYCGDLFGLT